MVVALLVLIVLMELVRLVLYVQDSNRVRTTNELIREQHERATAFAEQQNDEWKKIREAEIEELRQVAKESDTMKQIYDEWVKAKRVV